MQRQDSLIETTARELGLAIVRPLAGGEFGACLVEGDLVLKAFPVPHFASGRATAARLVERLRTAGYPAPRYHGTGATDAAVWSLQELMAGDPPPDHLTEPHARQLVELARRHADAADEEQPWAQHDHALALCDALAARAESEPLADAIRPVLERADPTALRTRDVVHNDFHHKNHLCHGDAVTAVFDWERASAGDWRVDLANLAVVTDIPAVHDALRAEAEPATAAYLVAWHVLRYTEFIARTQPAILGDAVDHHLTRSGHWFER